LVGVTGKLYFYFDACADPGRAVKGSRNIGPIAN